MSTAKQSALFPNESSAYRAARNELLEAEIALRRNIEAVAAQRRKSSCRFNLAALESV
jgi:predicted dithiol-disulfide oxidoreductase (DUF899 family)